ncbi:MAG: HAD family hydrolase, partial [Acidimicrobiales bacterium]
LDKTVISRASIMAFARDFRREGLLSRRAVLRGLWLQLGYLRVGASPEVLARARRSVLAVTRGWQQDQVRRVVAASLASAIDPLTYVEARSLIDAHRRSGRPVYLVSASPAEIVEPLAAHLGTDGALASVARVDAEGRYTGELATYAFGDTKATLMRQLAAREGIDLATSYAYTDSATDLPMLEAVGHPVAVNPDRALRRVAEERGWDIVRFEATLAAAPPVEGTAADHAAAAVARRAVPWARWAAAGMAAVAVASGGGGAAIAWRHRSQLVP